MPCIRPAEPMIKFALGTAVNRRNGTRKGSSLRRFMPKAIVQVENHTQLWTALLLDIVHYGDLFGFARKTITL